jgi:two-component system, NarL family, sensor histidine kinase DevS
VPDPPAPSGRSGYSDRLRLAAFSLPALLLTTLMALEYFVIDHIFPPGIAHFITLIIGLAGILAFSVAIFRQLARVQERERQSAQQLRLSAEALEQRRQQLSALNAAGLALTSELDRDQVLQRVVDQARAVARAKYAALGVFDAEGLVETFTTSGISAEERARIGPLPHGLGLLGLLQQEKRPLRVREIAKHPASVGFPKNHPPMRSFVGTPIVLRGETLGNLYLTEKQGADEFTADDEEALLTLAAQAAIAIENARLYAQEARVATLEERNRIRMDLHDGVMQSLYGVGLLLEDVAERLDEDPEQSKRQLWRSIDRLNASIADLRGYVIGLRPVEAGNQPLGQSLAMLAEQARSNALLDVEVDVKDGIPERLDRPRSEAAYYIAADALGNVARHARARHASLRFYEDEGVIVLEVSDDGVGFDYESATSGHGLGNMRERAFAVGGTLRVESRPGHGARVRLELPTKTT